MAKLHDEHDRLLVIVRALSDAIAKPEPPPQLDLFELRTILASTLIGHLKTEDWALYPALFRDTNSAVAATARRFSDEMGGLANAFSVYSGRWTTMTILANWRAFRSEEHKSELQ